MGYRESGVGSRLCRRDSPVCVTGPSLAIHSFRTLSESYPGPITVDRAVPGSPAVTEPFRQRRSKIVNSAPRRDAVVNRVVFSHAAGE